MMALPMSDKLFYAILAMDAYDRGYGAELPGLSDAIGTKLGNASVIGSAGDDAAQKDGFYAIAYELDGQKIIAYRGTDETSVFSRSSDLWNGWVQGAGILSTQSEAAIRFYERIAGQSVFKENPGVVTTGHSLGGGLAGYIGALSNGEAYVYDAMPFGAASITRVIKEQIEQANWVTGPAELTAFLTTQLSRFVLMPDADKVDYISVDGEVLAGVRLAALTLGSALEIGVATALIATHPTYALSAPANGPLAGPWALSVSLEGAESKLDPVAKTLGAVDLHSQGLLALLQYAKDNGHTDWYLIADPLMSGWFNPDNKIAQSIGLVDNDQMIRKIVYSALDSGETPFGTVAIKALFDDANELGRFYGLNNLSGNWNDAAVKNALTTIASQYAGNLANSKSTNQTLSEGVFDYDAASNTISLDLRESSWNLDLALANNIINKQTLIDALTKGYLSVPEFSKVDLILSAAQKFDATVSTGILLTDKEHALILGDGGNDNINGTNANDYIYAYDAGNDVVNGFGGLNTVIYAGTVKDYKVVRTESGLTITELVSGTNQTDILTNIQQIKFADEIINELSVLPAKAMSMNYASIGSDLGLAYERTPFPWLTSAGPKGVTVIYDMTSEFSDEISALYEVCFDRLPDVDGLRFWESAIESYGDNASALGQVADSFLRSDEFNQTHLSETDEVFITRLYQDAFERAPDESEFNFWVSALTNGQSRGDVIASFAQSDEMDALIGVRGNLDTGIWAV